MCPSQRDALQPVHAVLQGRFDQSCDDESLNGARRWAGPVCCWLTGRCSSVGRLLPRHQGRRFARERLRRP